MLSIRAIALVLYLSTHLSSSAARAELDWLKICDQQGPPGSNDPACKMYCNANCKYNLSSISNDASQAAAQAGSAFAAVETAKKLGGTASAKIAAAGAACGLTAGQEISQVLFKAKVDAEQCARDSATCDKGAPLFESACSLIACAAPYLAGAGISVAAPLVCQLGQTLARTIKCSAYASSCNTAIQNAMPIVVCTKKSNGKIGNPDAPASREFESCGACCDTRVNALSWCSKGKNSSDKNCMYQYTTCTSVCNAANSSGHCSNKPGDPNARFNGIGCN
jgi:hypothetical protein